MMKNFVLVFSLSLVGMANAATCHNSMPEGTYKKCLAKQEVDREGRLLIQKLNAEYDPEQNRAEIDRLQAIRQQVISKKTQSLEKVRDDASNKLKEVQVAEYNFNQKYSNQSNEMYSKPYIQPEPRKVASADNIPAIQPPMNMNEVRSHEKVKFVDGRKKHRSDVDVPEIYYSR